MYIMAECIKVANINIVRTNRPRQSYKCRLDKSYKELMMDFLAKILEEEKDTIILIEIDYMNELVYQTASLNKIEGNNTNG
jgi:hypothetical protein